MVLFENTSVCIDTYTHNLFCLLYNTIYIIHIDTDIYIKNLFCCGLWTALSCHGHG